MKKVLITLIALLAITGTASAALIAGWDFDGIDDASDHLGLGLTPYTANDTIDGNLTTATVHHSVPGDLRSSDDNYNAIDWEEASNLAGAITYGNYYKLNLTAASGYEMNLDSLSIMLDAAASIDADQSFGWAITDSSNNSLATGLLGDNGNFLATIDLTGGTFDGLSSTEFRVYAWDSGVGAAALSNPDKFGLGKASTNIGDGVMDIAFSGDVTVVPEPATVGMLGLGSLVALLIRRVRG